MPNRRRKVLTNNEIKATEFVSMDFIAPADKLQHFLVTLTNECADGTYKVVVWLWDKTQKLVIWHQIKLDTSQIPR